MNIVMEIDPSKTGTFHTKAYENGQELIVERNAFPLVTIAVAIGIISIPVGVQGYSNAYPTLAMAIFLFSSIFFAVSIMIAVFLLPTKRIISLNIEEDQITSCYILFDRFTIMSNSYKLSEACDLQLAVQPYHKSNPTYRSIVNMKNGDQVRLLDVADDEESNRRILRLVHQKTGLTVSVVTMAARHLPD